MGQTDSGHAYAETEQISYGLSFDHSELSDGQPAFRLNPPETDKLKWTIGMQE